MGALHSEIAGERRGILRYFGIARHEKVDHDVDFRSAELLYKLHFCAVRDEI